MLIVLCSLTSDKPDPPDLEYFLEFQVPRQWAPTFCELPLRHHRKKTSCPALQFSFLGPKLAVSSAQVRHKIYVLFYTFSYLQESAIALLIQLKCFQLLIVALLICKIVVLAENIDVIFLIL